MRNESILCYDFINIMVDESKTTNSVLNCLEWETTGNNWFIFENTEKGGITLFRVFIVTTLDTGNRVALP